MAVTIDNAVSTTVASATTMTINAPANIVAGDLLLFCAINIINSTVVPSGWANLSVSTIIGVWFKVATASEPASYTWSWSGVSNVVATNLLIKNSQGLRPSTDAQSTSQNAASTSVTAPTLTATRAGLNGQLLVSFYTANTAAGAITVPGGQSSVGEVHANSVSAIVGYETITATGATGTRVATAAASVANNGASVLFVPTFTSSAGDGTTPIASAVRTVPGNWTGASAAKENAYLGTTAFRKLPWWESDISTTQGAVVSNLTGTVQSALVQTLLTVDVSGALSGVIEASGVPLQGVRVNVHWRPTWQRIWTGYTDAAGAFTTGARYRVGYAGYVVTVEMPGTGNSPPYTSTLFNSMIADRPLPV